MILKTQGNVMFTQVTPVVAQNKRLKFKEEGIQLQDQFFGKEINYGPDENLKQVNEPYYLPPPPPVPRAGKANKNIFSPKYQEKNS